MKRQFNDTVNLRSFREVEEFFKGNTFTSYSRSTMDGKIQLTLTNDVNPGRTYATVVLIDVNVYIDFIEQIFETIIQCLERGTARRRDMMESMVYPSYELDPGASRAALQESGGIARRSGLRTWDDVHRTDSISDEKAGKNTPLEDASRAISFED